MSLAGSGFSPGSVMNPLLQTVDGKWPGNDKSKVGGADGSLFTHNSTAYSIDADAPGLGERPVALDSELSEDEKQIYIERGTLLKQSINEPALTLGYQFDIPNVLSSYSFVQTNSYFAEEFKTANTSVDGALISATTQKAYISASLIECLLMLTDATKGVKISGTFGLYRAIMSESDKTSRNSSPENGIDKNSNNSISDHVFGRAFDIRSVGDFSTLSGSKERYAAALDMVLQKINLLPQPLIPDLIVIHPDVAKDKGINEGFESVDTAIKAQYPNLKYVNFSFGTEHTDNIHISFSPQRGGKYIGSNGWKAASGSSQALDENGNPIDNSDKASSAKEKAYTNYKDGGPAIDLYELFIMLSQEGPFSDEVAAIFCAVAGRESNVNPSSYNGKCFETKTKWTEDVSVGMFQFNLLALIKKENNTAGDVPIYYDGSKINQQLVPAHRLAYNTAESTSWDPNAIAKKLVQLYASGNNAGASKPTTDDKVWYPINQVWMVMNKWGRNDFKKPSKIDSSSGFYHWGDYGDRSDCGFIFKTKFQNAVSVYLTTGKDISILEEWVRTNFKKHQSEKAAKYMDQWMEGTVFYSKPVDGSLIDEKNSGTINYVASVVPVSSQSAGGDGVIPVFTRTQIKEAADWISVNRVPQWLSKYRTDLDGNIQCDRFARVLSAAIGLFSAAQTDLINSEWVASGSGTDATIATPGLNQYPSAGDHLSALKGSSSYFGPDTENGKNPPAGYLVFWEGGSDGYGHVGISIGGGQYVDQHDETQGGDRPRPRSIFSTTFPGSKYTYAGCSSAWNG